MNKIDIAAMIQYEDADILVCRKPAGLAVQTKRMSEMDMESMLRNYLAAKGEKPYIGIVHRLDQPVEGIMVFAKNQAAAANLNRELQQDKFEKYYLAIACGKLPVESDTLVDYLIKDAKTNTSRVTGKGTAGAKRAELSYQVLAVKEQDISLSLVQVKLKTGRHHQIRVQLANQGCPLRGDDKYISLTNGKSIDRATDIALCSYHIGFAHPVTKKKMRYEIMPQNPEFAAFAPELAQLSLR